MTYWPISTPSVYSAAKSHIPRDKRIISHDGAKVATRPSRPPSEDGGEEQGNLEDSREGSRTKAATNGPNVGIAGEILSLRMTRNGNIFATITATTLTIWQTKPTAVLASVVRSSRSLESFGENVDLLLRSDSTIFVVQTSLGYLITYSLASDPLERVYRLQWPMTGGHAKRQSVSNVKGLSGNTASVGPGEGGGFREVSLRFRLTIKIDAGIAKALALDDELIIATEKPAAIQIIRWAPDNGESQTSTELLARMQWLGKKASIAEMTYDRPMNLSTWITSEGAAFAVQRAAVQVNEDPKKRSLFNGYAFHSPSDDAARAIKSAINARFSLIAVGCQNGDIYVYTAKDYTGNIPLSHTLQTGHSKAVTGALTLMTWSPDGYCIFAGFQKGWMIWSVYGKPGASSFTSDAKISHANDEGWLLAVRDACWIGGGSQLMLVPPRENKLWILELARSAVAGCFSSANVSRSLLQTNAGFMICRGYELPDMTAISADTSLWHHVQVPAAYLADQWPIRSAVISSDGRYVAVAGRRGLAHYSVSSGRWKTFDDPSVEDEFTVRGGMCWHQHVLIAATESSDSHEIRVYSRELALDNNHLLQREKLPAPIVLISPSGEDSLLVYTYENILYHYIIRINDATVKLVQVGHITLHGIIRSPPRVRGLSWILPESQLHHGDPTQDVSMASVLFLVDGKLVLLQPSTSERGALKYDMRIVAQNVEYYALMRDQPSFNLNETGEAEANISRNQDSASMVQTYHGHGLRDSLWYFDGCDIRVWIDVQDLLASTPVDMGRELASTVQIPVDFYPLSALLNKGVLFGLETDLIQRRDLGFAQLRFCTRTHLFIPPLLRYHLTHYDSPAALHLTHHYAHLVYFPHALEILLHDVLDDEVDAPSAAEHALLPSVLSFLSSFPQYLDIVVQCTRKTELRSWRTLFAHLPSPEELFEESLSKGWLKTAGGYLLVLHTFEESNASTRQSVRLLRRAKAEQDWDLCKELARFLMALDESGDTLREAMEQVELRSPTEGAQGNQVSSSLRVPVRTKRNGIEMGGLDRAFSFPASPEGSNATQSGSGEPSPPAGEERLGDDYFSARESHSGLGIR